jgi:hypothetical protein
MTLQELRNNASFHELLLMDATIKAHGEMMDSVQIQSTQRSAKDISRDLDAILQKHILPSTNPLASFQPMDLRNNYRKAMDEFRSKYDIQ